MTGHYTTYKDPPRTPSPLTRAMWRAHSHRAVVSRSAALRRMQRGWSLEAAITTLKTNAGRTDTIRAFLAAHPQATRDQIAAAVGRHRTAIRDTLNLLIEAGEVVRSAGTTTKNRPVFFYRLTTMPDVPADLPDDDEEPVYRPYINPIRRRIL